MKIFREAGLPDGVINLIFARGADIGDTVLKNPNLAGIHFTGSTGVFHNMWKTVGENIATYKSYPRIVGETGGKDFIVAHPTADVEAVATAITRGAFEFQGQKCSAASRAYIPKSLWPRIKDILVKQVKSIKMGDPEDFTNFFNAVIDESAFDSITEYIDYAAKAKDAEFLTGGKYDKSKGYFIEPTIVVTTNPDFRLMQEEIFGPVMTIYVYDDAKFAETLHLCDRTSPYALTGAIFATDRNAIMLAERTLAQRGRQLLHQRQADRRGGGSAAVRRRPRVGDERQGGRHSEHAAVDVAALDQGELRPAEGLPIPVHGVEIVGGRRPRLPLHVIPAP